MKRERIKTISVIVLILVLCLAVLVFFNLPKPVKSYDTAFDLMQIEDGSYPGSCDNGLVKVQVEVVVQDHEITKVLLLEHDNGLGGAAEVITDTVVQQQSVEVDTISGATMSSKSILKAVETALLEGQETR